MNRKWAWSDLSQGYAVNAVAGTGYAERTQQLMDTTIGPVYVSSHIMLSKLSSGQTIWHT